jgi:hypothetical protein
VANEIKHLVFKGIEKKEQILFKSFLNLAKNELEYQVVILKDNSGSQESANIVIADSSYQFSSDELYLKNLPTILVGSEMSNASGYIVRPVQWSDFKSELTLLDLESEPVQQTLAEQILPKNMEFAIVEMDEKSDGETEESGDFSDADEYDFELDNLSIDYHSFTNSEYMKVVNDVKGFKEEGEAVVEDLEIPKALVLVTDDESGHTNSVLVIETNSLDAWEMSESVIDEDVTGVVPDSIENEVDYVDTKAETALSRKLKSGAVVAPGNEFWSDDSEVYAGREQLMFIKIERNLVYSHCEPGRWVDALRKGPVTKVEIDAKWRPTSELKAFPISRLMWANTVATKNKDLAPGLDSQTDYILERWPHFDLLELDNMLLKLCTMLFVQAESPYSLMQKSGYSRSVVYGLINACHELDILRVSEDFDLEKFSEMNADDGVFGKIKDVFRS